MTSTVGFYKVWKNNQVVAYGWAISPADALDKAGRGETAEQVTFGPWLRPADGAWVRF